MQEDNSTLPIRNILIIGNNYISSAILSALLSPSHTQTTVTLLTYPSQEPFVSSTVDSSRFKHRTCDFQPSSLRSVFVGQGLAISTISGGDSDFQILLVDATIAAGVPRFIPNEFGQDSLNEAVQARLPPNRERARVIEYLRSKQTSVRASAKVNGAPGQADGPRRPFSWVGIAVGTILDQKLLSGDLGFDLQWHSATVHGTGSEQLAVTSLARIGTVVANVIQHWDQVQNQYLYTHGCITTMDQIVQSLKSGTKQTWEIGKVETEECVREAQARFERGFPDAGMVLTERSVLYDESLGAVEAFLRKGANGVLGLAEEEVQEIVKRAVHEFRHQGKADCGCG